MKNKEVAWDLSVFYNGPKDPRLTKDMDALRKRVNSFTKKYRGKIVGEGVSGSFLVALIKEYEEIRLEMDNINEYTSLLISANQTVKESQEAYNKVKTFMADLQQELAFVEIELSELLKVHPEMVEAKEVKTYKHLLERAARNAKYLLSEDEEKLLIMLNRTGVGAWQDFQSSHLGGLVFKLRVDGKIKRMGFGEALGYLHHKDEKLRKHAHKVIFSTLQRESKLFASALRNISEYHVSMYKKRGYKSAIEPSFILNDIDEEMYNAMSKVVFEGKKHFQEYLGLKAKLMGKKKLRAEDVTAPVVSLPHQTFSWEEAKDIIIKAYSNFSPEFGEIVKHMFESKRIDASPRQGKRQGAFCAGWAKGKSAFILTSFTGTMDSVYTIAHELGHAIHSILTENQEPYLLQDYTMVIAEVASTFGEMILTNYLLSIAKTKEEKLSVLVGVLDNIGQTVFQVFARTLFELDTYDAIERGEFLDEKKFAELWAKNRDTIHGSAVKWPEFMNYDMWTWKPHPYMYSYRFYNYPYVWSQLMSLALYQAYREKGEKFIRGYRQMLAAGGSKSPGNLAMEIMGMDLTKTSFWRKGMRQYESLLSEFKSLLE